MKRQNLLKSTLCLIMALVCNVTWAQEAQTFTHERQTTAPEDGYYLIYSESTHSGTVREGWVHYDASLDRKYRVATDVDLSSGVTADQAKFIWKLVNNGETFTLLNLSGEVYMPADGSRGGNMSATTPANLAIEEVGGDGNEGKWYVSQTNNTYSGAALYIHANTPSGYPNLSYWDGSSVDGTSIRAQFYKVDMPETTYTVNYLSEEYEIATTTFTYPTGFEVPEFLISDATPDGYSIQNITLEETTYTVNVENPKIKTLTLTPTEFQKASGKSTWTYHGTTTSGGWYGKFVTGTTPSLTAESTDETANNMGWASNQPWLKAGYTYNLTLPEGYVFAGYELTTKSTSSGYSGTYTYTTAEGTGTSEAQNVSTEKTVRVSDLSTNAIALTVNGQAGGSNYGILITKLVIRYKIVRKEYTIDKPNGNLYKDNGTSANQNWNSAWRSNADPQLVFTCGANNMNWVDNNVQMMAGQSQTATYTLTAPEGYVISKYSFTFANNNHTTGLTLTMNGEAHTTSQEAQTISATRQALNSTSFVLAGTNGKGVILTDYTVTIVDAELAAAQTEAWATVEGNAGNLKDAIGYYSYTIGDTKVYDAQEVMEAIDKAASVADIESIVASYHVNLPEVGKYYRIKGHSSGKYLDAVNRHSGNQMGMKTEAERDFYGSIFLLDEDSKWLNMGTNTYIKETYNIGADKNGANTWTFEASPRTVGCLLLKSSGGSPYLHDSGYANRCSGDGGHAAHDFVLEEVKLYTLTVNASNNMAITATWNGIAKPLPATWQQFEGSTINSTVLTVNSGTYTCTGLTENEETTEGNTIDTGVLTANRTITANCAPNFFSTIYGEKWVRLQNCSNTSYWAKKTEAKGATATKDNTYADDSHLWCLVGDANSFVLYNKAAGEALALKVTAETYGNGSPATFEADNTATWKLKEQDFGYALVPTHNTNDSELGINMYGGGGGDLKLFATGNSNTGSYWKIEAANPLTIGIEVEEGQPYATNTRVAELTKVIAGASSKTIVKRDTEVATYYLPATAIVTLTNDFTYRGYTFDGFKDDEGNVAEYTDAAIPVEGLALTASYSVDENNKYQYLFYSNDPVMDKPYRIPAIAVTRTGTILAVTDHRPGGNDVGFAPVDIKIRRSNDNGQTWTDEEFIADGTGQHVTEGGTTYTNVFNYAFGDAALVADRESDEVLIMCVGGKQNFPGATANSHNYIARLRSHDGGVTWDEPENVTANFMDVTPLYNNENPKGYEPILPNAYSMFYGSGRIFQSRVFKAEGSQYYRIYAALLVREVRENETGASHNNYVVYSDNFGETWNLLGGRCVNGGDEAKVEELPDGTIIISSRKAGGRYFNIFTFTDIAAAEGSWGTTATSTQVYDGGALGTDGEIYKVKAIRNSDKAICDVMLQSVPLGPGRSNVMIHYKEMEYNADGTNKYTPADFATGWNRGLQVSDKESAYSTLALQTDGNFGFFYEEVPNYYCMVYVPLSLEEITKGAYSLYTVNSTIGQYGVGTFYASEAMQIPEGITAYVADNTPENGYITLTELEDIIPANTGALIYGGAKTYNFIPSISYGTPVEGNMLVGFEGADNKAETIQAVELPTDGSTNYVLTVKNDVAGFYRKEAGFNVANNKAYLQVPAAVSANALRIRFAGEEGNEGDIETGIESVADGQQPTVIYDLQGRRVLNPTKGMYIVNGKKIVIK